MDAHRRKRLKQLLDSPRFGGSQAALAEQSGLTKGRISQLLDSEEPFGERAARSLERKLNLGPRWFDRDGDEIWPFDVPYSVYEKLEDQQKAAVNDAVCALINGLTPPKKNNTASAAT